ncbi:MAG: DeoR/GlpR transcriptional regulator [Clostridia bacterium]|nr:DeoR/GlpR transcriptional regulator [Clostridia bacterium]
MSKTIEKEIFDFLSQKQFAQVEEISTQLNVSPSTVRRKLTALQEKGLVLRRHGGAQLADVNGYFPSFTFRVHQNSLEKKKIALQAIKLIKNGDLIFLDGTTSAYYIAEYLSEFEDVRVLTNGIDTLSLLAKNKVTAYSTGGRISNTNRSVLVGEKALNSIDSYRADIAFFSTSSIKPDGEIYDCFEEENAIREHMLKHAKVKVFLCDKTKFGKDGPFHLCTVNDIDYIVTDEDRKDWFDKGVSPKILY